MADKTGIPQPTIHRLVNGKNKRLDLSKIRMIEEALGIAEAETEYQVTEIHRALTPDQEKLVELFNDRPDAQDILKKYLLLEDEDERLLIRAEVTRMWLEQKKKLDKT